MSKRRQAAKIDSNQPQIVSELESAGFSVEVGYDDIIVGKYAVTLWVEDKTEDCYSMRTGKLMESAKTPAQKKLDKTYTGARIYAKCSGEIFAWFGINLAG